MSSSTTSHVREFNAVSFPEAIFVADQLIREQGVGVAVWMNRDETMLQEQLDREKFLVSEFCRRAKDKMSRTSLTTQVKETIILRDGDPVFNQGDPLQYLCLFDQDEKWVIEKFSFRKTELAYELGYNQTGIHTDGQGGGRRYGIKDQFFFGNNVRIIHNLIGTPTMFYSNGDGAHPYALPPRAVSFFDPSSAESGGTWHSSSHDQGRPRVVHLLDMCV